MESCKRPDIFEYHDFRRYLGDLFAFLRRLDRKLTKSAVCKKVGLLNSRSYFQDVLNGKFVSKPKVEDFIRAFALDKEEAKYFRLMVNFNQATDSREEREWYFERLLALNKTPRRLIPRADYAYYKEWYNPVIRAVLNVYDIRDNYADLAAVVYPPVTAKQAEGAVKLLRDLKLVKRDGRGYWKPTEKNLSTGPMIRDEMIRQYQLQRLEEAQKALMHGGHGGKYPHRAVTRTLSISAQGLQILIGKIGEFSSEVGTLIHADDKPADRVYQLDVWFYPCAKPRKSI